MKKRYLFWVLSFSCALLSACSPEKQETLHSESEPSEDTHNIYNDLIINTETEEPSEESSEEMSDVDAIALFEEILRGEATFINTANNCVETYINDVTILIDDVNSEEISKAPHSCGFAYVDDDFYPDMILHFSTEESSDVTMILHIKNGIVIGHNLGAGVSISHHGLYSTNDGASDTGSAYYHITFTADSFELSPGCCRSITPTIYYVDDEMVDADIYTNHLETTNHSPAEMLEYNNETIDTILESLTDSLYD